jgi:orotidine-5'-phosphate decarboxylase
MAMLKAKLDQGKYICAGLDTDPEKISGEIEALIRREDKLPPCGAVGPLMHGFNRRIIEQTKDLVCAYKFNLKFYLAELHQGLWALQESIAFVRQAAPDVPTILDSKDGDIGISMGKAAEFAFAKLGVDAVTVNPWGGKEDSLDAFLKYKDRGIFVWCYGSHKGHRDFQWRERAGLIAAIRAARDWNAHGNCGVVAGATHPEMIREIRKWILDVPLLIPGIGAQGGDLKETIKAAMYKDPKSGESSLPAIINSSRGVIYASGEEDFAKAARKEVMRLKREINKCKEGGP